MGIRDWLPVSLAPGSCARSGDKLNSRGTEDKLDLLGELTHKVAPADQVGGPVMDVRAEHGTPTYEVSVGTVRRYVSCIDSLGRSGDPYS